MVAEHMVVEDFRARALWLPAGEVIVSEVPRFVRYGNLTSLQKTMGKQDGAVILSGAMAPPVDTALLYVKTFQSGVAGCGRSLIERLDDRRDPSKKHPSCPSGAGESRRRCQDASGVCLGLREKRGSDNVDTLVLTV
ncbi:hypothetical protein EXN66_Car019506 [Channa argus]|uniref:Uncharacterized protein n=1 Tax=Channa argus TaxID=215402 RepID=A0A6G1QNL2_CHAAH|nr:hypothetical protein EXN66_Car019506 [Channa argus]